MPETKPMWHICIDIIYSIIPFPLPIFILYLTIEIVVPQTHYLTLTLSLIVQSTTPNTQKKNYLSENGCSVIVASVDL